MKTALAILVIIYLLIGCIICVVIAVEAKQDDEFNIAFEGDARMALLLALYCTFTIFGWLGVILAADKEDWEGD